MVAEMNADEMLEVMIRFDFKCALTDSTDVHIDHWFPKKYGGLITVDNAYPLDATLNERKSAGNPFEFFERDDIRKLYPKDRFDDLVFWLALNNNMTVDEFRDYTNNLYNASQLE